MATIYRFIVEGVGTTDAQQILRNNDVTVNGEIVPKKGAGSKGGGASLLAHNRGGVDHNRYMRPINPLINRVTGGYWEKGQRVGRALQQLPADFQSKGLGALGGVASLILIQFAIMEVDKYIREQTKKAKEENQSNFLKQKSGASILSANYKISRDMFGKITYTGYQGVGSNERLR
jgi:hypothetical protein